MTIVNDENGHDARYEDWLASCRIENQHGIASDGQRVTSAKALQIAADVLHCYISPEGTTWTADDIRLALGAIAGIRAQQGDWPEEPNCDYLTHYMDICIYG